MNGALQNNISFGEFELDPSRRKLCRGGEPVAINAKTFDLLVFFIEKKGRIVTKEEVLEAVWKGQFVEEANLSVQISALRKALGESKTNPRFLLTIPGTGYKFIADFTKENEGIVAEDENEEIIIESRKSVRFAAREETVAIAPSQTKPPTAAKSVSRKTIIALAALVLLAFSALAAYRFFSPEEAAPQIKTIAVLPFKPLLMENRNESLEMGMADTLIAKLSNFRDLSVRPVSAVRKYASLEQDAVAAGREQRVDAVLDGQIQQAGEKIRVTVRLIRVADASPVWTAQFDEKMTDIFAVQDSISERVAGVLALKLSGEEKKRLNKRYTENAEAYRSYLLGRFHFAKRTRESMAKSIEYFERAIEKDPNYALAYAGLAGAYSTMGWNDFLAPHDAYPKAKAAVGRALQLDEALAEAHAVAGNIKRGYDWNLAEAEKSYRRALELDPNNPTTHHWYGLNMAFAGRHEEAVALLRRARDLDPLSLIINKSLGDVLSFARRCDEGIEQFQRVLELDPNFPNAYREMGTCYYFKNMPDRAIEEWFKGLNLAGTESAKIEKLQKAYKNSGMKGFWLEMAEQTKRPNDAYISSYDVAVCYAAASDKQRAIEWLERAYKEHSSGMVAIKAELWFDSLAAEPQFVELTRRVGLPL
ncbi:MAG TPA: winged helix-turn-helix domain-containing protein [Pyrinomonadaceae bacterium]|jgi:DNA-binding winged helix-turn-helix (wHTH) protein/TolB-like protein